VTESGSEQEREPLTSVQHFSRAPDASGLFVIGPKTLPYVFERIDSEAVHRKFLDQPVYYLL
jgi:hypothetical protein